MLSKQFLIAQLDPVFLECKQLAQSVTILMTIELNRLAAVAAHAPSNR